MWHRDWVENNTKGRVSRVEKLQRDMEKGNKRLFFQQFSAVGLFSRSSVRTGTTVREEDPFQMVSLCFAVNVENLNFLSF